MPSPFPYSLDNKRYHTWNYFVRKNFGSKVYKVPLSLATTCPNRDGLKGHGGCTFCANGGGGTPYIPGDFSHQFREAQKPLEAKWPGSWAMAYFQSYSNTYLPISILREALYEALKLPKLVGICIATRPDCLPTPVLDLLEELQKETFVLIELGLQTVHEETAKRLNRGHSYSDFAQGYNALKQRGLPVCVHLINGLPYESREMMLETAKVVGQLVPHSVKFHMLHILKGSTLANEYKAAPFPLLSREEYVSVVCSQLQLLAPETVIQRVTGDPPSQLLIAPQWTLNKLWVRNAIDKQLASENFMQGDNFNQRDAGPTRNPFRKKG